ncbi:MAG: biotin-dependent carboxyltransferase family protein [Bacteroidetes bacterium]|nr:biotin-dependent carboxyltransferase family protein [Bacteroidota bacterium]
MSLKIINAGIADTIQDLGRYGHQQSGINPSGAMDIFSAQVANFLVGNKKEDAVIELHFPASTFLFEQPALIAITGADFSATINGEPVPVHQPVIIKENSVLRFEKWKTGAWAYLAIREKLNIPKWLNSYSTNLKAHFGGYQGRCLHKNDTIPLANKNDYSLWLGNTNYHLCSWKANVRWCPLSTEKMLVLQGNEWSWLSKETVERFTHQSFTISSRADRMGYQLKGSIPVSKNEELISSAVSFGTVQLLPNGELISLMADHQTTGGYPRIVHIISVCLPQMAQKKPGEEIYFQLTDPDTAEQLFFLQQQHLQQLQNACTLRLRNFLNY